MTFKTRIIRGCIFIEADGVTIQIGNENKMWISIRGRFVLEELKEIISFTEKIIEERNKE